jgi:hypothetical protein
MPEVIASVPDSGALATEIPQRRSSPPGTFEADLAAWSVWLDGVRADQAEARLMRKLEVIYAVGWTATVIAGLATPVLGLAALMATLVLVCATLMLGYVVTLPRPERVPGRHAGLYEWPKMGADERARLIRIMNLSRLAARPRSEAALLIELEGALQIETLSACEPLRELRERVRRGSPWSAPFGCDSRSGMLEWRS